MGEHTLNKLSIVAKSYIVFHVLVTCLILYNVILRSSYSFSFTLVIPFIFFGSIFEFLHLDAFAFGEDKYDISIGSAIIVAAIMLFNPLELIIFAFFYGISILIFPMTTDLSKIIFNVSETINVTYMAFLVWNFLHIKN